MYTSPILNPELASLLARFRHTNCIVITDLGFPFWPQVPTVDISLTKDIPSVRDVLRALEGRLMLGKAWMAKEFWDYHDDSLAAEYRQLLGGMEIQYEAHDDFKKRVPDCIGLIRTGDSTAYGNLIIESA
jgi:D-ribose pyranase